MKFFSKSHLSSNHLSTAVRRELQPANLFVTLVAGGIIGLVEVVMSLSFVALIFTGDLSTFVGNGVGLALTASVITTATIGIFSSLSGIVGGNQDIPAAILAIIAVTVSSSMISATAVEKFVTITAVIGLTTLLTGVFLFALGQFKLGRLVRFLPYPVIGGFLAGTGWLLTTGAIGTMTRIPFGLTSFEPVHLAHWLPGLLFAVVVLVVMKRWDHALVLPGAVVLSSFLFYLVAFVLGETTTSLSNQGWLLGPFPDGMVWRPLLPADLAQVQWRQLIPQSFNIATIVLMSAVALLLNGSALELAMRQDINMDHDLKVSGLANIVAGLFGGLIGFHLLSVTMIGQKMTASAPGRTSLGNRLAVMIAAASLVLTLIFGASALALFPRMILGGLLLLLGLSLLEEWVILARAGLPHSDYFVVILILLVTALVGFLEAVVVGLAAAVVLFVINYSNVEIIRHELTGANKQSRVTRSLPQKQLLSELGHTISIFQIQGFVFFGTANNLIQRVQERVSDQEQTELRYLVLDFRRVTGIDSTASLGFDKLQHLAGAHDFAIVLTEVSGTVQQQVEGNKSRNNGRLRIFPDLDQGLAWCEEQLLATADMAVTAVPASLPEQLQFIFPQPCDFSPLLGYCQRREISAGQYLMQQGDTADALYFLESGQVTAQLEPPDQPPVRLETMRGGHVIGEIGYYLDQERTAAVIADEPCVVYSLSKEALAAMEKEMPEMASSLHQLIIHLLGARVTHLVTAVDALQR